MILNRKNFGRGLYFSLLKIKVVCFLGASHICKYFDSDSYSFANQNDSQLLFLSTLVLFLCTQCEIQNTKTLSLIYQNTNSILIDKKYKSQ